MTPQERDMLTNLISRLRQTPTQDVDPEAEGLINDLVREQPHTPYILAQTVLIQDYALHQAQARITELEQQVKSQQSAHGGGFLSAIFGGGKPEQPRPQAPVYQQAPQPAYQQPAYQQPAYAPPPAGPWGQAPGVFAQPAGQPSFLRSAATTAAGIAGGALLFQGVESLFGGHGGGFGGGFGGGGFGGAGFGGAGFGGGGFVPQPSITETVVNNYYGDAPGNSQADFQPDNARFDDSSNFADTSFDDDGSFSGGGDFGGGDDFV